MKPAAKKRLGDIVLERGLVTRDELENALQRQRESGAKLGEILVSLGVLTPTALAGVIKEQWEELDPFSSRRKPERVSEAEAALHDRIGALTAALEARDERIAEQEATIVRLLARLGGATT